MIGKLLVIGKKPPPIGGVTIHVERLLAHLKMESIEHVFFDLAKFKLWKLVSYVKKAQVIHLHSSNVYFRFLCALILLPLNKKLITTFHGNLGRYGFFKNILDYLSVKFCVTPIVLNEGSFKRAISLNPSSTKITAFIPPLNRTSDSSLDKLFKPNSYKAYFCTNAYNVSYDKNGNEIYGILQLIKIFNDLEEYSLIISDPSSAYANLLKRKDINVGENIQLISFQHSFIDVIKNSDCFIRATTTDGDSLSVREALYFGKKVICSDCVERPPGCILFPTGNFKALTKKIKNFDKLESPQLGSTEISGFQEIVNLYHI